VIAIAARRSSDRRCPLREIRRPVGADLVAAFAEQRRSGGRARAERLSGALGDAIMMLMIRLVAVDDAPVLAELLTANRKFLAPWQPTRAEDFFTTDGQREAIDTALIEHERGITIPNVILTDGRVVGRVTLSNIVGGPFQSCNLGYWVDSKHNGRGLGTAAVREIVDLAFGPLGLHRVEAGTLRHNIGSQRVLERNGFVRFGTAPAYLKIAGSWQDHVLYQAVNHSML
jgi:ribosomal-protein-alanine N-acetyltransferase